MVGLQQQRLKEEHRPDENVEAAVAVAEGVEQNGGGGGASSNGTPGSPKTRLAMLKRSSTKSK
ncbi:unnamed protein product, partial [Gongylonema pulchrum]|uniref:Uncharacterized protein n=1 Tax=Gongylonema pulchrum TaxID=637853 RepID=A0A183D7Y7_9BILA